MLNIDCEQGSRQDFVREAREKWNLSLNSEEMQLIQVVFDMLSIIRKFVEYLFLAKCFNI